MPDYLNNLQYNSSTRILSKTVGSTTSTVFTVDNTAVESSNNPITSGVAYTNFSEANEILEDILHSRTKIVTTAVAGATVTATSSGTTYTATGGSDGKATMANVALGTYTVSATYNGVSSTSSSVTVATENTTYTTTVSFITLLLTIPNESTYTVTDGTTTYTGTSDGTVITQYLPNTGTWTVSCTDGTSTASESVTVSSYTSYEVTLQYIYIHME